MDRSGNDAVRPFPEAAQKFVDEIAQGKTQLERLGTITTSSRDYKINLMNLLTCVEEKLANERQLKDQCRRDFWNSGHASSDSKALVSNYYAKSSAIVKNQSNKKAILVDLA